jgi:hypothetical protein
VGEPVWTPYNREDIDEKKDASRQKYVENILKPLREGGAASDSSESADDSNKRRQKTADDAATA